MFDSSFELTITELLREPMVRALMKADRVDVREFETRLRLVAGGARRDGGAEGSDETHAVRGRRISTPLFQAAAELRCGC